MRSWATMLARCTKLFPQNLEIKKLNFNGEC